MYGDKYSDRYSERYSDRYSAAYSDKGRRLEAGGGAPRVHMSEQDVNRAFLLSEGSSDERDSGEGSVVEVREGDSEEGSVVEVREGDSEGGV